MSTLLLCMYVCCHGYCIPYPYENLYMCVCVWGGGGAHALCAPVCVVMVTASLILPRNCTYECVHVIVAQRIGLWVGAHQYLG